MPEQGGLPSGTRPEQPFGSGPSGNPTSSVAAPGPGKRSRVEARLTKACVSLPRDRFLQ
ncbi:uncharacterized protein THITE_2123633 [Thermothielavioides terrestris NRRL 8126]|uniref:Uncharacterized protein n=1 Tax=Thermothielavioides terrestris (strain ATCC 38088 / NRRL 8126) TaxID=578455 RepID=G2RHQ4_THETT|nr:uncharacterized protein THITE_2123633 [Thermothielavioides terrestris NRRL 8126]AEO71366.1 hypothetical protein THITE_2123633 [Thermothielavioides terrestris NRRL 8126]